MTRIALITGASRGLGAALAEALAHAFHIVAVARTTGALEELDDRIQAKGGQATLAPMDITNADAMAHLCRGIHDRWGHADLWLHTAIHAPLAPAGHIDAKDWDKSIRSMRQPPRRSSAWWNRSSRPHRKAVPSSSTTRALVRSSSPPTARPRPRRWR